MVINKKKKDDWFYVKLNEQEKEICCSLKGGRTFEGAPIASSRKRKQLPSLSSDQLEGYENNCKQFGFKKGIQKRKQRRCI